MINKAFKIVCDKTFEVLEPQQYKRVNVDSNNEDEIVALFTSENVAYSVIYFVEKMHMVLRTCAMTDEGPDNEWKTLATWIFDPDHDTEKEAQSIGNDFADTIGSPVNVKRTKQTKKKKSEDGSSDPLFLSKRLVKVFPELQEEIRLEEESFEKFRGVTFTKMFVVPKVQDLVKRGHKGDISKLMGILSAQYLKGDRDTRAIITIVILNSIDTQYRDIIEPMMSDELSKAYKNGLKYKNKKVKPEKVKKTITSTGSRL